MDSDGLSRTFAALADPTRRAILVRLAEDPATVGEIAAPFAMSAPAISQHLKVLEEAGLITRTVQAQWRTVAIEMQLLDEVTTWIQRQRREWNLRLDSLEQQLEEMKESQNDDPKEGQP